MYMSSLPIHLLGIHVPSSHCHNSDRSSVHMLDMHRITITKTYLINLFSHILGSDEGCFKSHTTSELRKMDGYLFRGRLTNQNPLLEQRTETKSYN